MSTQCVNCGVLVGPAVAALAVIIGGISTRLLNWSDLKNRAILTAVIGMVLLALSSVWMIVRLFVHEDADYLWLFTPSLIGLAITGAGVYRLRHDANFTGVNYAFAGIVLFFGSLLWMLWVLQAFS